MLKLNIYHLLHVASLMLLAGYTFAAFANPSGKDRKRVLMITGILNLLIVISGFGMLTVLKLGFPGWIIVKLVCWIGLAALAGLAYRRQKLIPVFTSTAIVLIVIAVGMVYFRPSF